MKENPYIGYKSTHCNNGNALNLNENEPLDVDQIQVEWIGWKSVFCSTLSNSINDICGYM